ncbi:MAG: hypothetical protein R8G66_23785 [Cytophagales bacterium]|nr:hypothetical protein [Cytophagales bacterium]
MRQLIFVALLLCVQWANAQTNFEPGYIINNAGDSVQGEINFNWTTRPDALTFRTNGGKEEQFTPSNLKGFSIENGDYFQSLTVEVDVSPTDPDQLLELGKDQFEEQSFFAKVLLLGSANLYQNFDQERGRYHYFLENAQSPSPVELISGKRKVSDETTMQPNASGAFKTVDKYKGQLTFLLGDCPEVMSSILGLSQLTEKSVTAIITTYNGCNNNVSTYRKPKVARGSRARFGLILGAQLFDVQLENSGRIPADFDTPADFVHNIGFHILLNTRERKRFNLGLLGFHRSFKTSEVFFQDGPVVDGFSTVDYNWQQFTFILNGNFNFGVGDKYLFLSVGPGIGFTTSATGTKTFETANPVNLAQKNSDRQFLINFEAGYQWRRLRASLSYELGGSMAYISTDSSQGMGLRLTYFIPHPNPTHQNSRKD